MPIPISYAVLAKKLADARSWAINVTEGNRCALVVGTALGIQPRKALGETTFRDLPNSHLAMPKQPFLDKFYVKAGQLRDGIAARHGAPDVEGAGRAVFPRLANRRGVAYLEDCWVTPTDDTMNTIRTIGWGMADDPRGDLPRPTPQATGDHIDLFDGTWLEIYRGKGTPDDLTYCGSLIKASAKVCFWETPP
ncbi:hypothetical protein [Roseomonas sp. HF4]|uniref:hypothetical protein n=1 Tax=Roseomonas sp. HF4 TaxID=2562313 RepID=UPI0010C01DD1|nr:hypothetical protein [Roseomonas sp. HF4]